jgi:hypothetical protein
MKTTLTWLLAGAAVTLCAGVALAADKPAAKDAPKTERREVHIYRQNGEERIVIDKDGEHHEFYRNDGDPRRFEMSRGPDGERTIIIREGGGRSEHLKALLQLRPEQEPALKAFLEATQPDRSHDHMVRFDRGTDARTTSERLSEMESKMAEQQAAMRKRIDATRAFYNQLDDKQRKAFDAMPMLMMVGPGMGPMMLPGPIPIVHRIPPAPPIPPVPPVPPAPPHDDFD